MNEAEALVRAVELARRGRFEVEPNPMVGAVVLAGGEAVGEGWHVGFGGPHAEVAALAAAGGRARGATVVVTLEPCSTRGKTPPCTEALRDAGVVRVVAGAEDPDPRHQRRGLSLLREAGLEVECRDDPACRELLSRFTAGLGRARPWVIAKWAMSADGAVAGPEGATATISSEAARARVHHWRAHLDAIMVGVGTVVADDPRLTVRGGTAPVRPLRRVVLDPTLRVPLGSMLVSTAGETPTWVFGTDEADEGCARRLEDEGVVVRRVPAGEAWLEGVLASLHVDGVRRLMVEGGPRTLAGLRARDLVDQYAVFTASGRLGPGALPALPGESLEAGPDALARRLALEDVAIEELDGDRLVRGFARRGGRT